LKFSAVVAELEVELVVVLAIALVTVEVNVTTSWNKRESNCTRVLE